MTIFTGRYIPKGIRFAWTKATVYTILISISISGLPLLSQDRYKWSHIWALIPSLSMISFFRYYIFFFTILAKRLQKLGQRIGEKIQYGGKQTNMVEFLQEVRLEYHACCKDAEEANGRYSVVVSMVLALLTAVFILFLNVWFSALVCEDWQTSGIISAFVISLFLIVNVALYDAATVNSESAKCLKLLSELMLQPKCEYDPNDLTIVGQLNKIRKNTSNLFTFLQISGNKIISVPISIKLFNSLDIDSMLMLYFNAFIVTYAPLLKDHLQKCSPQDWDQCNVDTCMKLFRNAVDSYTTSNTRN